MEGAKAKDEVALSVAVDASAAKQDVGHKRASRSRLAAMIGGLALVGTAVGLVGVGLSNSADSSTTKAAAPSYSADLIGAEVVTAAGVKGGPARGRADLDVHNVLTWALRKLEPETSGTIHLHAGTSCNALGSSHWDTEVTSSNPWTEVTWSSDSAGKSEGTLNIDELVGAYSFPANLRHAVVFYSHDQQVLACGLLKPEGDYRKFGVQSVLNNGFEEHQSNAVAGEVILSKANVLSWGVYNLQAEQSGVVSVLAGRDCSDPDATRFTTEWSTDKWGTSRSEAAIDSAEHDFSDLVGRAVVIRNAQGAVVACNTLSVFVEKTPAAIRAIRAELRDIVDTYKSDGYVPPVPLEQAVAVIEKRSNKPELCLKTGTETIINNRREYEAEVDFLRENEAAYRTAIEAQKQGTSTPEQDALIEEYGSHRFLARQLSKVRTNALSYLRRNCYNDECLQAKQAFSSNETAFEKAVQQLDSREAEFASAVAAVSSGTATPEQQAIAEEYHTLVAQQQTADANLEQLVVTIMEKCPENTWCTIESDRFPSEWCTPLAACNNERLRLAEQGRQLELILAELYEKKPEFEIAVEAEANGNATEEQEALIAEYRDLQRSNLYTGRSISQGRMALERNPVCQAPVGSVTLSSDNIFSWNLNSLLPNQKGHIMILEAPSCFGTDLGGQAALSDTTPFTAVYWDTTDDNGTSDEGTIDLSTLVGALPYEENHPRAVVVYTADGEEISCGDLKEAETL